jgi:hypothetical protein
MTVNQDRASTPRRPAQLSKVVGELAMLPPVGCRPRFFIGKPRRGVICKAMPQAQRHSVLGAQQGALLPPFWQQNLADILARV